MSECSHPIGGMPPQSQLGCHVEYFDGFSTTTTDYTWLDEDVDVTYGGLIDSVALGSASGAGSPTLTATLQGCVPVRVTWTHNPGFPLPTVDYDEVFDPGTTRTWGPGTVTTGDNNITVHRLV